MNMVENVPVEKVYFSITLTSPPSPPAVYLKSASACDGQKLLLDCSSLLTPYFAVVEFKVLTSSVGLFSSGLI